MAESIENKDNSSDLANDLFTALTSGITIPDLPDFDADKFNITPDLTSDLYKDVKGVTIAEVTEKSLDGEGAFDVFMAAMDKHLEREFKGNRITGSQYAEVYTAVSNNVLNNATNFALNKDQANWAAITAQMQARIVQIQATEALINLEKTKYETIKSSYDMHLSAANYALTKMQTATEEAQHDSVTLDGAIKTYQLKHQMPAELAISQYERTAVMPSTVAMNQVQVDRILPAQASISEYQNRVMQPLEADIQKLQRDRIIPTQADMEEFKRDKMQPIEFAQQQYILNARQPAEVTLIKEQIETQRANTLDTRQDGLTPISGVLGLQKRNLTSDADTKDYVLANQLPRQVELIGEQITLTTEQHQSERAKTLDTRSDGETVVGSVGKQKDLYTQQIDSFIKDAAHKTAKMYLDAWVTQKTLDEGLAAPTQLTNNEINDVLAAVRNNNNL
ncbi:virion structural protein [Sulfitobacter phage phiCB2047-B]|uniref:Uncharacterized protein n=1 Tax=Sulfitobacter phage phiCB2047-B TaxID=754046 RepID=M4PMQ9_9CAUD|nr:virion structural protein [Sulfitobacter phage phiCB2047-B]AGH07387.1 hypothetical protein SUFG_00015 [Sulfitobacter phage phiCB2047-B]